jgi:hypothetical protein
MSIVIAVKITRLDSLRLCNLELPNDTIKSFLAIRKLRPGLELSLTVRTVLHLVDTIEPEWIICTVLDQRRVCFTVEHCDVHLFRVNGIDEINGPQRLLICPEYAQSNELAMAGYLDSMHLWVHPRTRLFRSVSRLTFGSQVTVSGTEVNELAFPNGHRFNVLVDCNDRSEELKQEFVKQYLEEKCGFFGGSTLLPVSRTKSRVKLRFSADLPATIPSGVFVIRKPDGTGLTWKWSGDTPIEVVIREIVELIGRPREEFIHFFPPDVSYMFELAHCVRSIECIPRFVATVVHGSDEYQIKDFTVKNTLAEFRESVFVAIKSRHPDFKSSVQDLIFSDAPEFGTVFQNDSLLAALPQRVFVQLPGFSISFRHGRFVYTNRFGLSQTVADARLFISNKLGLAPAEITLSYWGKELRDSQPLDRIPLKSDKHVLVFDNSWEEDFWLDELSDAQKGRFNEYRFYRPETDDHFTIPLLATDLGDRARLYVAERYHVNGTSIRLMFQGVTLFDDTMIGQIEFGDYGEIEVIVLPSDDSPKTVFRMGSLIGLSRGRSRTHDV